MTDIKAFFKLAMKEIKKVRWPDKDTVIETTTVVVACSAMFAVYLFLVDVGIQQLFAAVLY